MMSFSLTCRWVEEALGVTTKYGDHWREWFGGGFGILLSAIIIQHYEHTLVDNIPEHRLDGTKTGK